MSATNCDNLSLRKGNTKPSSQSRKWVITWNNYKVQDINILRQYFATQKCEFIIGQEVGESGTPHLQVWFQKKTPVRFSTLKKLFPKCHIEKSKGTAEDNFKYCSKDGIFESNIKCKSARHAKLLNKYKDVKWKNWQQSVIDLLEKKADDRTINWYWETTGNVGKSFLAKYLVLKYNAIIADGKKDNIFNQINGCLESGTDISVVLLDVPRYNMDYVNYGCLEQIKNGMLYSGKYEGGVCLFDNPHLIVFANEPPEIGKMSSDRWNIVEIGCDDDNT